MFQKKHLFTNSCRLQHFCTLTIPYDLSNLRMKIYMLSLHVKFTGGTTEARISQFVYWPRA